VAELPGWRTDYLPREVFFGRLGLFGVFFSVWACDFGRFFPATSAPSGVPPWRTLAGKSAAPPVLVISTTWRAALASPGSALSQFQQKATAARRIEILGSYKVVIRETRGR
jgi:hypothetical protein